MDPAYAGIAREPRAPGRAQARAFRDAPFAMDAVRLRRWDDRAKDPRAVVPPLGHFEAVLHAAARLG